MVFKLFAIFIIIISTLSTNQSKILSRKKRFLVFPEGASLSVSLRIFIEIKIIN